MKLRIVIIIIALVMVLSGGILAWSIGVNTPPDTAAANIQGVSGWEMSGGQLINPIIQNFRKQLTIDDNQKLSDPGTYPGTSTFGAPSASPSVSPSPSASPSPSPSPSAGQ